MKYHELLNSGPSNPSLWCLSEGRESSPGHDEPSCHQLGLVSLHSNTGRELCFAKEQPKAKGIGSTSTMLRYQVTSNKNIFHLDHFPALHRQGGVHLCVALTTPPIASQPKSSPLKAARGQVLNI